MSRQKHSRIPSLVSRARWDLRVNDVHRASSAGVWLAWCPEAPRLAGSLARSHALLPCLEILSRF